MNQKCSIFYSWESDLPGATNRQLIQAALESAADTIRSDNSIDIEPVIDRDTVGVPGSPDITNTIFAKIDEADIFVVDVSIITGKTKSRKMPNPNVLVELGYALKALGADRVMMVMNMAHGSPELLPFDLRMKRVVTYDVAGGIDEVSYALKDLTSRLEQGLREIIGKLEQKDAILEVNKSAADLAIEAVNGAQANQVYLVRQFMKDCLRAMAGLAPTFPAPAGNGQPDDILVETIGDTVELVIEFSRVAEAIAVLGSREAALGLLRSSTSF